MSLIDALATALPKSTTLRRLRDLLAAEESLRDVGRKLDEKRIECTNLKLALEDATEDKGRLTQALAAEVAAHSRTEQVLVNVSSAKRFTETTLATWQARAERAEAERDELRAADVGQLLDWVGASKRDIALLVAQRDAALRERDKAVAALTRLQANSVEIVAEEGACLNTDCTSHHMRITDLPTEGEK